MAADRTRSPAPARIAFAGDTLHRAAHLRDDAERLRQLESSRDVVMGSDQELAITRVGALALAPLADLPSDAALTFLGLDATGRPLFAYDAAPAHFSPLRSLMAELDPAEAAVAAYAVGMV